MIVRVVPMKDASVTGTTCSCQGPGVTNPGYAEAGPVKDLGPTASTGRVMAALHVLSCTAGGVKVFVQANSSSGFTSLNTGTDIVAFTSRTCRDSQWAERVFNCASATSTQRRYWRAAWTQTCSQENKFLVSIAVEP